MDILLTILFSLGIVGSLYALFKVCLIEIWKKLYPPKGHFNLVWFRNGYRIMGNMSWDEFNEYYIHITSTVNRKDYNLDHLDKEMSKRLS